MQKSLYEMLLEQCPRFAPSQSVSVRKLSGGVVHSFEGKKHTVIYPEEDDYSEAGARGKRESKARHAKRSKYEKLKQTTSEMTSLWMETLVRQTEVLEAINGKLAALAERVENESAKTSQIETGYSY